MVEVKVYETVTAKKNGEVLGVFNIKVSPEVVPEINPKLKGKEKEEALAKREKLVDEAIKNCQFAALDKVRELVGINGILVATIIPEEENA